METFDAWKNYKETRRQTGYVPRKQATQKDYDAIGFKSGLEVHQQLDTKEKLFCRCPAGIYNNSNDYDAELIRHMRPTLSEMGEYDGTALMEFKTRKEIIYRVKHQTTCTYEVDDTPPFPINREALEIAIEISMLSKLNIVGEVHVTRKQYLDGSIPTGFQRTAIIGVEGEIPLKNKKVRLIQLSIEEDSCREISDVRHTRIYRTDRLGMPLIETVTYPEMLNPDEVKEACDYIRFLNRSTGKVRTGIGTGRQDVNVSCEGGTRVEIKGVAHTKWIPELTHNECYRQWALLKIREILLKNIKDTGKWNLSSKFIDFESIEADFQPLKEAKEKNEKLLAINLPGYKGILSHFTQPGKMFADEISDRLKVIACIEKPHMAHSEELNAVLTPADINHIMKQTGGKRDDAQLLIWGPEEDMKTAIETVEERCRMAFEGVPNETRKSFEDGTTIFERVLPGADRMYPDTDTVPIPLGDEYIEELRKNLPREVIERYQQLKKWEVPQDTYTYIFTKNLYPIIERIVKELGYDPVFTGTFFGHTLKFTEGHYNRSKDFSYKRIFDMFEYVKKAQLEKEILKKMLPVVYEHPKMDFESVLVNINYKAYKENDIVSQIPFLKDKFEKIRHSQDDWVSSKWIMGELRKIAVGNVPLHKIRNIVEQA